MAEQPERSCRLREPGAYRSRRIGLVPIQQRHARLAQRGGRGTQLLIPRHRFAKELPHLDRVMWFSGENDRGPCFHRSVALLMDMPRGKLAIGTLRAARPEELEHTPNASLVPFIHCWVELEGYVLAPTTVERAGD